MSLQFQLTVVATLRKRRSNMMPVMAWDAQTSLFSETGIAQAKPHRGWLSPSSRITNTSQTLVTAPGLSALRPEPRQWSDLHQGGGRACTDSGQARADKLLEREKTPELQLTSISLLCSVSLQVKAKNFVYRKGQEGVQRAVWAESSSGGHWAPSSALSSCHLPDLREIQGSPW